MMKDLWKFVQEKPPSVNGDGWGWGRWWAQMDGADGDGWGWGKIWRGRMGMGTNTHPRAAL